MSLIDGARQSLRGRLAVSLVVGSVVVLSLSFIALHLIIRGELYAHLDQDLSLRMRAVADYAIAHPGSESITEFMPQFRTRAHQDFFQIWDGRGRTLARSDSSAGRDLPHLESVVGRPMYHDLQLPDGHRGRAVSESFALPPGDPRRALTVVTAEEIENLESLESRIHFSLLLGVLAAIVAMLLIARYSILRGLRPLDDLARELEQINPEDPHSQFDAGPLPSELRPVAASFSALLDRLLDALAREKRYARNVAHELRTPLAEMRLLADVGSSGHDPDVIRAAIRDIGVTAAEMERIVESLLALTRYEAGLESPQPEPIDLCAELRRQAIATKAAADLRGLTIELHLPGELWVHADSTLVRRLLANLLGNAIAHTPHGSIVTVLLNPRGELQMINPAPNLVATDVPRLAERFFRISTGNGGSHAGLGLALAAAIAKVLRLRLDLSLRDDGCLVASVDRFQLLETSAEPSERFLQ
jgi:two-component system sensor histidine kinase QseC